MKPVNSIIVEGYYKKDGKRWFGCTTFGSFSQASKEQDIISNIIDSTLSLWKFDIDNQNSQGWVDNFNYNKVIHKESLEEFAQAKASYILGKKSKYIYFSFEILPNGVIFDTDSQWRNLKEKK